MRRVAATTEPLRAPMKPAASRPVIAEARRSARKSMRTLGEIVLDQGETIECTVLDMSGSGARLKIRGAVRKAFMPALEIPGMFRLMIPRENIAIDCRLAWRENELVGVSFASSFRPIVAATPRTANVRPVKRG